MSGNGTGDPRVALADDLAARFSMQYGAATTVSPRQYTSLTFDAFAAGDTCVAPTSLPGSVFDG